MHPFIYQKIFMEYSLLDMQKNVRHNPCCRGAQYLDRQTDKREDRQTEIHIYIHIHISIHIIPTYNIHTCS